MPELTPNTAPGSIPDFPIPPYGVDTFTDFDRGLVFTTLHFRHGGGDQAAVLLWVGNVLDQLTLAGIPASGPVGSTFTPDVARSTKTRIKWRCHLKVPVDLKVPVELK